MEINRYLENVLMSGEEKDTKAKWYYGKIKNTEYYGFIFNVVINEKKYRKYNSYIKRLFT